MQAEERKKKKDATKAINLKRTLDREKFEKRQRQRLADGLTREDTPSEEASDDEEEESLHPDDDWLDDFCETASSLGASTEGPRL